MAKMRGYTQSGVYKVARALGMEVNSPYMEIAERLRIYLGWPDGTNHKAVLRKFFKSPTPINGVEISAKRSD